MSAPSLEKYKRKVPNVAPQVQTLESCEYEIRKAIASKDIPKAHQDLQRAIDITRSAYFEVTRQCAEQIKMHAIRAPPDKQSLQTVPWKVGEITGEPPNKSELTKRTDTSIPTIQKKSKKLK